MRITQNSVLLVSAANHAAHGQLAYVYETPNPAHPGNGKRKIREIRTADGAVIAETDVSFLPLNSVDELQTFLNAFKNVPQIARGGYDKFVNECGPTNPQSPNDFSTEGLKRIIAVYTNVLHVRVAAGGVDGEEAAKALSTITEWNTVAGENLKAAERESLLVKTASMFTAEEIEEVRSKAAGKPNRRKSRKTEIDPPAASVNVEEAADAPSPVTA